jgi:hypothetical protein
MLSLPMRELMVDWLRLSTANIYAVAVVKLQMMVVIVNLYTSYNITTRSLDAGK